MFKIESLLSKHLVSALGVLVAAFTLIANVGCAGVTAAPNSNSPSSVSVQVTPSTASLQPGSAQQFSATVTGGSSSSVTWSATGGMVSSTGLYTAPATPGAYTVQATSTADTSKSGSATITVLGSSTTPQISFSPGSVVIWNCSFEHHDDPEFADSQCRSWHTHCLALEFHRG